MIYDAHAWKKRPPRGRRAWTVIAVAALAIASFVLGGMLVAPIIRAGSDRNSSRDARSTTTQTTPSPTPLPDAGPPDAGITSGGSRLTVRDEPEVVISAASPEQDSQKPTSEVERATTKSDTAKSDPSPSRSNASDRTTERAQARSDRDEPEEQARAPRGESRTRKPGEQRVARASTSSEPDYQPALPIDERYINGRKVRTSPEQRDEPVQESRRIDETERDSDGLEGVWSGVHTGNPARLRIARVNGDRFEGTLTVRVGGRPVRLAVAGRVTDGDRISWEETVHLRGDRAAWDLGANFGRIAGDRMEGRGRDRRGRAYSWWFDR